MIFFGGCMDCLSSCLTGSSGQEQQTVTVHPMPPTHGPVSYTRPPLQRQGKIDGRSIKPTQTEEKGNIKTASEGKRVFTCRLKRQITCTLPIHEESSSDSELETVAVSNIKFALPQTKSKSIVEGKTYLYEREPGQRISVQVCKVLKNGLVYYTEESINSYGEAVETVKISSQPKKFHPL